MPKRARIGDVVEISTKRGFAYGHYVLRHEQMGALLRVFPGFFSERPTDFTELVSQPPRLVTFFPIGAAVHRGIFPVIAHVPVSEADQILPPFKARGHIDRQGRVHDWWIRDGERERRISGRLPTKYHSLPEWEIINDTLLIERLQEDWTPELEMQRVESRGSGDSQPWAGVAGAVRRLFGRVV
jgi:hypothetical protein